MTVVGWERASSGAGTASASTDVAQLLAAGAAATTTEVAVDTAFARVDREQLVDALPLLQPGVLAG